MKLWRAYLRYIDEDKKWIQKAIQKPGALHQALGVPQGEKIPASKLAVKPGDSTKMKRRKILAKTLSHLHKEDFDLVDEDQWIAAATKNKGALHRQLGVPQGEKIPKSKLVIKSTDTLKTKRRKILAKNLSHLHKK